MTDFNIDDCDFDTLRSMHRISRKSAKHYIQTQRVSFYTLTVLMFTYAPVLREKSNIFKVFLTNLVFYVNTTHRIRITLVKTDGNIPWHCLPSRFNGFAINATT